MIDDLEAEARDGADEFRIADFGFRIEDRVAVGPPSLPLPSRASAGRLYKQTQSASAGQAGGAVAEADHAKQTQFPRRGTGAGGTIMRNKANSPPRTGRRGPGRSQACDNASLPGVVPATNPIGRSRLRKTKPIPPAWPSVQNKPNFRLRRRRGPGAGRGAIVRNKANWEKFEV